MTKSERRKLRKEALRAFKEEGQETAYKGRWIRRAETSGVRKYRKRDLQKLQSVYLDPKGFDLSKLDPGVHDLRYVPHSSFLLSEVEEAK